eukprot:gene13150-9418_t
MASFASERYEVQGQETPSFKELGLFHAKERRTGKDVVLKPVKNLAQNPKSQEHAVQVSRTIQSFSHPTLQPLLDSVVSSVDIHNVIAPLPEEGRPATVLTADRSLSRSDHLPVLDTTEITAIALQLIPYLTYLHAQRHPLTQEAFVMRDLRPDALWIRGHGAAMKVSVIDLSAAMMLEDIYLQSLDYKTLPYVPPEVLHKKRGTFHDADHDGDAAHGRCSLTSAVDMWSLGLTLLDLATGYKTRSVRRGSNTQRGSITGGSAGAVPSSGVQTPNSALSMTRSNSGSSLQAMMNEPGITLPPASSASTGGIAFDGAGAGAGAGLNAHTMLLHRRTSGQQSALLQHQFAALAAVEGASLSSSGMNPLTGTVTVATSFDESIYPKLTEVQRQLFHQLSPWVQGLIRGCLVEDPDYRVTAAMEQASDTYDRELLRHDNAVHALRVAEQEEELQRLRRDYATLTRDHEALRQRVAHEDTSAQQQIQQQTQANVQLREENASLREEVDRLRKELIRK